MDEPHLNRTFYRVHQDSDFSDPQTARRKARFQDETYKWPELRGYRHVVILGEAGKGKTTEFRQQEEIIDGPDASAFFLRVVDLADEGLPDCLWPAEESEFNRWKNSQDEGHFFLDAVDEVRLESGTLESALKSVASALQGHFERVHWYLSCRVSDWRPEEDVQLVREFIQETYRRELDTESVEEESSHESSGNESNLEPLLVLLGPLNRQQIRQVAEYEGVSDSNQFMNELEEENLETLSERPRDVQWMARFWERCGQFGSLREMISENIAEKLEDRGREITDLSQSEARTAAELLAARMTLEGASKIRLSVETGVRETEHNIIEPSDVLCDWTTDKHEELLSRGLFTEATYGCVRFHHRSAREYLAANWLLKLRRSDLEESTWWRLVFRDGPDGTVVPNKFRPTIAWIAGESPDVRDDILKVHPEILLQYGDPEQYTPDERKRLLRRVAEDFQDAGRRFEYVSDRILDRFAHEELVEEVSGLLRRDEITENVKRLLLRIVERGGLERCREAVVDFALDDDNADRVRIYAVDALEVVGTDETFEALAELLDDECLSLDLTGRLLRTLYPGWLSTEHVVGMLSNWVVLPEFELNNLRRFVESGMVESCPRDDLFELLDGIKALLPEPESDEWYDVREIVNPKMLSAAMGRLATRLIRELETDDSILVKKAHAVESFYLLVCHGGQPFGDVGKEVEEALREDDQIRPIFWKLVNLRRNHVNETITRSHELSLWMTQRLLGKQDIPWLENDAENRESSFDRLLAFDILLAIYPESFQNTPRDKFLADVADGDEAIEKRFRRAKRGPVSRRDYEHKQDWREKKRKLREHKRRCGELKELTGRLEMIREGRDLGGLCFLYERFAGGFGTSYSDVTPEKISDTYHSDVLAEAFTEGCKQIWRKQIPPRQCEESDWSSTSGVVCVGLAGLTLDVSDGLDFSELSEDLARKAARYAVRELNGPPEWFPRLAQSHPDTVQEVWMDAALRELEVSPMLDEHLGTLHGSWRLPAELAEELALSLIEALEERTGASSNAIRYIRRLVAEHAADEFARLGELAQKRCESLSWHNELRRRSLGWNDELIHEWLHLWLESEPSTATEFLIQEFDADRLTTEGAQQFLATINRSREFVADRLEDRLKHAGGPLADLVKLAYSAVRPSEDKEVEGARFVDERDRAEEMRRDLVRWLGEVNSEEAKKSLEELAHTAHASPHRDFLLNKAARVHERIASRRDAEIEDQLQQLFRRYGTGFADQLDELGIRFVPKTVLANRTLRQLYADIWNDLRNCPDLDGRRGRCFYKWLGLSLQFLKSRIDVTRGNAPDRYEYLFSWGDDDSPDEFDLQSDYWQFLTGSGLETQVDIEVTNVAGGRADVVVDFGDFRFIAELKQESSDNSRENLRGYLGQTGAYQSTDARVSLLLVLDLTEKPEGSGHITENVWVEEFEPNDGDRRWAVVVRVPGNRPPPSATEAP